MKSYEEYLDTITGIANESYDNGLEDAWQIAGAIYQKVENGGLKGADIKKYFGCSVDDIYNLPIQEVVKAFRQYEEDCNLDWSRVPVDTPILVRKDNRDVWVKRHFARYENGKICTWAMGATSWSCDNKDVVEWDIAKLAEE